MSLALVVVLLLQQPFFATNDRLGYRFELPSGFAPFAQGRSQKDVVDCWSEVMPYSQNGAMVLCVQRLHGRLGRERLKPSDVPPSAQLLTYKWKGFDIDGLRTDTSEAGVPFVVFVAQVPLRKEGIQLILGGPADQATRAQAIMTSTLGSLEGETNWLTDEERAGRLGNIAGWWLYIAVAVIIGLIIRKRRARAA